MSDRIERTVFISYRRTSAPWALAIYQNLTHSGYDVFFDYEGLGSGDFEQVILANIRARAHFLIVLTPSALQRIDKPGDWLRREVEVALESRRNIVPLMLEGFDFETPSIAQHLTGSLEALKRYNGLPVVASYFEESMERLRRKHLSIALSAVFHPPSLVAVDAARHQQAAAANAPQVGQRDLSAEQWFERGWEAQETAEKIRCFTEVIRLNPRHVRAYVERGFFRAGAGDLEAAMADYAQAVALDPTDAYTYWSRASVLEDQNRLDEALADVNVAISLKPGEPFYYSRRGGIHEAKRDLKSALDDFAAAIRIRPSSGFHYRIAGVYRELGQLDDALSHFTTSIELDPLKEFYYRERGHVNQALGKLEDAVADFGGAIRLRPDDPRLYFHRARTLQQLGKVDEAVADYDRCIAVESENPPADDARLAPTAQLLRESLMRFST